MTQRHLRLGAHLRIQTVRLGIVIAGGVDQQEIHVAQTTARFAAVAGHPRPVIDNGQRLSGQAVEKRGFTHIRPSHDGDAGQM